MPYTYSLLAAILLVVACSRELPSSSPAPVTPPRQVTPIYRIFPPPSGEPEPQALPTVRPPDRFGTRALPEIDVDRRFYRERGPLFGPSIRQLPMTSEVLPFATHKTISRGFDGNRNNWLDPYEIHLSDAVRREASGGDGRPHNGIVGTTEMARALNGGRVKVSVSELADAQRVAQVLVGSIAAREFLPGLAVTDRLDRDQDGRLSASELADALMRQELQVGRTLFVDQAPAEDWTMFL